MTYDYLCTLCKLRFTLTDVPMSDYKEPQPCSKCGTMSNRAVSAVNFIIPKVLKSKHKKNGFKAGYNAALGCHVGGERHFNQILRERGLECAGDQPIVQKGPKLDDFPDEMVKQFNDAGMGLTEGDVKSIRAGDTGAVFSESDQKVLNEIKKEESQ